MFKRSILALGFVRLLAAGSAQAQQAALVFTAIPDELRFDVAIVLILSTVGLCAVIDALSRGLRRALRISTLATRLADAPAR